MKNQTAIAAAGDGRIISVAAWPREAFLRSAIRAAHRAAATAISVAASLCEAFPRNAIRATTVVVSQCEALPRNAMRAATVAVSLCEAFPRNAMRAVSVAASLCEALPLAAIQSSHRAAAAAFQTILRNRRCQTAICLIALVFCPLLKAGATPEDNRFQALASDYIGKYLEANPEQATQLGDHRFDDRLTNYSAEALAQELAKQKDFRARLNALGGETALTGANRVDFEILRDNIDYAIFQLEELKEPQWNPLVYNESLADSLYLLVVRDFAPAEKRIPNLRKRMEAIPAVIAQAKANLQHPPRVHTETAIEQTQGAISFVREGLSPLLDQAPQLKKEIAPLQEATAKALEAYKKWLQKDLLPRSNGNFRIGPDKFRKKLHFALASDLSAEEIMKRAEADLAGTQAAIYETALPLYKEYFPKADKASLADKHKVTAAVLDKLAETHPDDATVVGYAQKVLSETTEFVKKHDLVTVPQKPLDVIVMPEFKRGPAIAYCDSPGPLEENGKTFFAIAPTPNDWSAERKKSFYREYNNYMIHDLTVHEAMPGHYLQLAHSNQFHAPTLVRAIFQSGTFIEGWAVYAEQMMAEAGFGGPEVKMQQLKMRLRVICNAIIDQRIHMGDMTEKQAIGFMEKEGFQQEGEAVAKWKRARLTSAQLSTYFVGVSEHLDLRARAKAKAGNAFNLKKYNNDVISFGSPPVKYVRELLGL